jgi:hypothetical protein
MPVYQYEGVHYDLPDGFSNEQAIAKIQSYLGVSAQPARPRQTEYTAEQMAPSSPEDVGFSGEAPSEREKAVGRTLLGVGKGIVNPALAVGQFVAPEQTQDLLSRYKEARTELGGQGLDVGEIIGTIVNPLNRFLPAATAVTRTGRAAQYAGQGAVLGALTPAEDAKNLLSEKISQIGFGAVLGGVLSSGIDLGKGVYNIAKEFAKPLTTTGQKAILQERFQELASKEPEKIIAALRNAPETIPGSKLPIKTTAAEAIADIPAATGLAAYQKALETLPQKGISADFAVRDVAQQTARQQVLQKTGGTEEDILEAIANRTRVTEPLREDALTQANIAGQVAPRLEQQISEKFKSKASALQVGGKLETEAMQQQKLSREFFPVPGYPRVSPEYSQNYNRIVENLQGSTLSKNIAAQRQAESEFKKFQLQSLADEGFYPLRVQPIISNIDTILNKPGERASDVVTNVFSSLKEKLTRLTDPTTGIIDSRDLYTIRKEIGNDIKKFSQESQNWDAKLTSGLEKNVKSYIDNAIEKAGNSGDWQKYLDTFQKESTKINQMQIGQALEKQLGTPLGNKERAAQFAAAVENGASIIKRSTGQNRFSKLEDVLTPQQIGDINKVLVDVQRKAKSEELASMSKVAGQQAYELPQLLNRYATITNTVLKLLKKDVTDDINRYAADMLLDPPKLAAFIEGIPTNKMQSIITAFMSRLTPETRDAFSRAIIIRPAVVQSQQ